MIGEKLDSDTILGNPDVSSLADLGSSYERIKNMRLMPVDIRAIISVTVAASIPLAPLLLTVYPFDELLQKMLQIFV